MNTLEPSAFAKRMVYFHQCIAILYLEIRYWDFYFEQTRQQSLPDNSVNTYGFRQVISGFDGFGCGGQRFIIAVSGAT